MKYSVFVGPDRVLNLQVDIADDRLRQSVVEGLVTRAVFDHLPAVRKHLPVGAVPGISVTILTEKE